MVIQKSGLSFELALLRHGDLDVFSPNSWRFYVGFCITPGVWIKLGSQIFQNLSPWPQFLVDLAGVSSYNDCNHMNVKIFLTLSYLSFYCVYIDL